MIDVISFIAALGILVFVHEFGHFLVAKKAGVKVERFSLGFPPKMIGKKIGDTEYCISWIPLGGYVKMAGENPDEEKEKWEPFEFLGKPVWQRGLIIVAGPVMNFLLAILISWGIFFFNGIDRYEKTTVGRVGKDTPAEKAGLKSGDQIILVNGTEVRSFDEMAQIIYKVVRKPVTIKWRRGNEIFEAKITTVKEQVQNEEGKTIEIGMIGIGPERTPPKKLFQSFFAGVGWTVFLVVKTVEFLVGLFTGAASLKMVGGPIFIARTAGETAKLGLANFFSFIALLSVNLSIINILPIPVLDGGHILFLGLEKLRGKPLSLKQRAIIQQIGLAFLLILIIYVSYNDILRWKKG
ncbi:MAG: RIP metalloprotease RseP [candidate division Zixibacteria bacterium]|nr:RIP metalloprotease RseP [candidate division Zixibacteria bacterium]